MNQSDSWQDYHLFFNQLNSDKQHDSCLIISIEKPVNIDSSYQQLELQGLDRVSCQQLLATSELVGDPFEWETLISKYHGNPDYLKVVAYTIRDIFNSIIRDFLAADFLLCDRIGTALSAQLDRLTDLEISVLLLLMQECQPISLERLKIDHDGKMSNRELVKILDRLVRQYLIEVEGGCFKLSNLVREQLLNQLDRSNINRCSHDR